ncbi:MAG TPA: FtsQ-type POTRA domain-containing protein, partial [Acidimicrobiales bacterium]|nr:FtsQ-type POTRA domain-containing protein [Acidimicrobiales bacterium]
MDPRVAKRRAQVRADATRRRRRRLTVVAVIAVMVGALVGVLVSPVMAVKRVQVSGAQHTSVASLLAATGLEHRGAPMISLDRFALAQRAERLPWVEHAEVTRKWPNTVRIRVTERTALGVIGVPNGVAVVDGTGRVLATVKTPPDHTYAVTLAPGDKVPGPGQTVPPAVLGAVRILAALSKGLAAQAESVHRLAGSPPTYELTLHGPVTVRLGEATNVRD